jgi:site-specific DNA recombinase
VDPHGGGLKINAEEAQRVRFIYEQIAAGYRGENLLDRLNHRGWTTKTWISRTGRQHSGRAFQQSDLFRLIKNVTYLGKLRDGDQILAGEHPAIVDSELWDRANGARMNDNRAHEQKRETYVTTPHRKVKKKWRRKLRFLGLAGCWHSR